MGKELTETDNKILKAGLEKISFDEHGLIRFESADAALAWGQMMIESGFVPDAYKRPAQVVFAAQKGAELKVLPTAALQGFYPAPGGLLGIKADLALAILRRDETLEEDRFDFTGEPGKLERTCIWTFRRKGWRKDRWETATFSLREAKLAGLDKPGSGWQKYPDRMLKARCISFGSKDFFSDVLYGCVPDAEPEYVNGDAPSDPPPAPVGARRAAHGPQKDPFLEGETEKPAEEPVDAEFIQRGVDPGSPEGDKSVKVTVEGGRVVSEEEISEEDAMLAFDDLCKEAHARSEGDPEAQKALILEMEKVYNAEGIAAAQAFLANHEVFGDPKPEGQKGLFK